jgi:SulP family sulfate permease
VGGADGHRDRRRPAQGASALGRRRHLGRARIHANKSVRPAAADAGDRLLPNVAEQSLRERLVAHIRGRVPDSPSDVVPGLADLREYRRTQLRTDALAGVTIAAVAIPAGLGMGELAGLTAVAGLYATLLPLAAYSLFGSSRQLIVGPESALAILTAATIAPFAAGDQAQFAALAAMLGLLVGGILLVSSLLRLGFMADFLGKPVLIGYINGVALIILASQLGKLFGLDISSDDFFPTLEEFFRELGESHWSTVLLSAGLLALILVLRRVTPRVPGTLVAVVLAGVLSELFNFEGRGIAIVGDIPAGLPDLRAPDVGLDDVTDLALPAVGLALIAFGDTVATARTYAARNRYEVDANRELAGLGVSNIAAGFSQAFPVSASNSRTALNDASGGTSQVVALVAAAIVAIIAAFATPLIEPLPKAVLGVVVVAAAVGLFDFYGIVRLRRVRDAEAGLALAGLVGVLVFGVLGGLLFAVALSIGVFVYRSVRPHDAVLGATDDVDRYLDVERTPVAHVVPGLIAYRFDAPLYFPNATHFRDQVRTLIDTADPPARCFVLNAEAVVYIDSTAVDMLRALQRELADRGIVFAVARAKGMLRDVFDSTSPTERIGSENLFPSVRAAVKAFEERA